MGSKPVKLMWPFLGIVDQAGSEIPYVALHAPVRTLAEEAMLDLVIERFAIIGFTSFLTFPRWTEPTDKRDYGALCAGWCHCFRDPERWLPAAVPWSLLPYSDFIDPFRTSPDLFSSSGGGAGFDFVYVCQAGPWHEYVKNWELARRCLPVLCHDLGLRGLLVGRADVGEIEGLSSDAVVVTGRLPRPELLRCFAQARFLFVPSGPADASPRILAEALSMNTPVLVNRHILGGWHYVNPFTGAFFVDENDVAAGARRCLDEAKAPRRWYRSHYGPRLAGTRLAKLLRRVDPALGALDFAGLRAGADIGGSTERVDPDRLVAC